MRLLLHFPLQPSSRKVRLVLGEKKLNFEPRIEQSWERPQELIKLNPSGETPVLVDENNFVITGDPGIVEYLEEVYPGPTLGGQELADRIEIRRLSAWFDQKFSNECVWPLLHEKLFRRLTGMGNPDSTLIRQALSRIAAHMEYIGWLAENRNWLAGEIFSLADLSAASSLSCLDYLGDLPWEKFPSAKQWYARIKSRPSFRPLLTDKIMGFMPAAHYGNLDF